MRRILSILLASSALFSCSTEEVINAPELQPISFGNMFIENSTRAIYNRNEDLKQFYVYGNVKGNQNNTVNLYGDGTKVKRNEELGTSWENSEWICDVTQYWVPECTYQFAAISDVYKEDGSTCITVNKDGNGFPTSIEYNVSSQADLLYSSVSGVETDDMGKPKINNSEIETVAFTFSHLLSKVKFTFTNKFSKANGVELTVTGITITNATTSGTYDLNNRSWTCTDSGVLEFGSTEKMYHGDTKESKERLLIPGNQELEILLKVRHNKGNSNEDNEVEVPIKFAPTLEKGCSYNFTAELNAQNITGIAPITFNIKKNDWGNNENLNVGPEFP